MLVLLKIGKEIIQIIDISIKHIIIVKDNL